MGLPVQVANARVCSSHIFCSTCKLEPSISQPIPVDTQSSTMHASLITTLVLVMSVIAPALSAPFEYVFVTPDLATCCLIFS